ncbi:inositol-tetrakisphosphate 1-kinase 2-like [Lotus japonicus]|uniref:inositol-tetrakisphosphate 1-kinase 2-like n=1 Tax=Lotus japonicus TaxID=34305 RepID=UPI00258BD411|nr:inositol-tetrakisphosphate 1-kinase 2-like [Lotus japonicus]
MSDSEATTQRYRVGYALEPKKFESFLQPSLLNHAKQHGIDLVQIDPTTPLHSQAPFHCIIHKLYTQQWRKQLQQFSAENPNTIIIDPPESVDQLHNRVSMLESATHLKLRISPENATVGVPKQVVVNDPKAFRFDEIEEMGLRFPVIAKPVAANGTDGSHQLCLVFDRDGVNALTAPVVLQEFVNHGGVVFKVYVAGQRVICVKRKSLPDISEEKLRMLKGSVPFSQVSNLSEEGGGGAVENGEVEMPSEGLVEELGRGLREALGLHLFNVDLIRDGRDQRRYLVIDINYFPGYAKLPDYEPFFTNFLLDILQDKKTA